MRNKKINLKKNAKKEGANILDNCKYHTGLNVSNQYDFPGEGKDFFVILYAC